MNAGDFIDVLITQLVDCNLASGISSIAPHELNACLNTALKISTYDSDPFSSNLAFVQIPCPNTQGGNSASTTDLLDMHRISLSYNISWPICLVVTPDSISLYHSIFTFLLKIKRAHDALRHVWLYMKSAILRGVHQRDPRWATLELIRHEMLHFVNILQEYVINQVLGICWKEFKDNLHSKQDVYDVDELRGIHEEYLQNSLRRCMLNQAGAPVQQIINRIFGFVNAFKTQITSIPLDQALQPATFDGLVQVQKGFQSCSQFLYKILVKLNAKGKKPHLQQLIVFFNYNGFYGK